MLPSVSRRPCHLLIANRCSNLTPFVLNTRCCNRQHKAAIFAFKEWDNQRAGPTGNTSTSYISTSRRSSTSRDPGTTGGTAARRDFLEARQISLYELFDGNNFQLDIPDYQRPYAWKAKQVHELLSDLHQAYTSGTEHFLGAIVTTRQGGAPGAPYWVIDGQQRLTTLVMLLGYLRAWAASQPGLDTLVDRAQRMLFIPADPLNPESEARCTAVAALQC
eukprot:gene10010-10164_t